MEPQKYAGPVSRYPVDSWCNVDAACAPVHVYLQDPESETGRKKAEADRLRAAEKFMVIGSGTAQCKGCGYEYTPEKGDPDFPIPKGVRFQVGG